MLFFRKKLKNYFRKHLYFEINLGLYAIQNDLLLLEGTKPILKLIGKIEIEYYVTLYCKNKANRCSNLNFDNTFVISQKIFHFKFEKYFSFNSFITKKTRIK